MEEHRRAGIGMALLDVIRARWPDVVFDAFTESGTSSSPHTGRRAMGSEPKEAASRIEEMLLAFGGERVSRQDSDLDDFLVRHGELAKPRKVGLLHGREHNCHRNAAGFYIMNYPDFKLVTGYALSGEVWHGHSWLAAKEKIIETTAKRRLYFGVTLDDLQAAKFIMGEVFDISPSLLAYCSEQAATGVVGACQE